MNQHVLCARFCVYACVRVCTHPFTNDNDQWDPSWDHIRLNLTATRECCPLLARPIVTIE